MRIGTIITGCNPVGYGVPMDDEKLEPHRARLRKIRTDMAAAAAEVDRLTRERTAAVDEARADDMTWREAAELLGMTQHGLIKAARSPARDDSTSES